jgi:hypothetical protein
MVGGETLNPKAGGFCLACRVVVDLQGRQWCQPQAGEGRERAWWSSAAPAYPTLSHGLCVLVEERCPITRTCSVKKSARITNMGQ